MPVTDGRDQRCFTLAGGPEDGQPETDTSVTRNRQPGKAPMIRHWSNVVAQSTVELDDRLAPFSRVGRETRAQSREPRDHKPRQGRIGMIEMRWSCWSDARGCSADTGGGGRTTHRLWGK
jgi:hypothetical protein